MALINGHMTVKTNDSVIKLWLWWNDSNYGEMIVVTMVKLP